MWGHTGDDDLGAVIAAWATERGLHVQTEYRDEEVGRWYDDPIEVTSLDKTQVVPSGSPAPLTRLYPIYDEAAGGTLQVALNREGGDRRAQPHHRPLWRPWWRFW